MAKERIGKWENGREETMRMQHRETKTENGKKNKRSEEPVGRSNRFFFKFPKRRKESMRQKQYLKK